MTWVKICATTNLRDARMSVDAGANALGFIFAESKRRVTVARVREIVRQLPASIEKIGVFVNEAPDHVAEIVSEGGLTGAQLHGQESAVEIRRFRQAVGSRKLMKTFQASNLLQAVRREKLYEFLKGCSELDAVLVDSGSLAAPGGTGVPFDWLALSPIVDEIKKKLPVTVAGGLSPENVADAVQLLQPFGVDVASGVELVPGAKDEAKVKAFVNAVRALEGVVA